MTKFLFLIEVFQKKYYETFKITCSETIRILYTTTKIFHICGLFISLHLIVNTWHVSCRSASSTCQTSVRAVEQSSKCAKYLLSSADSEDEHSNCGMSPSSLADSAAAASAPDAN